MIALSAIGKDPISSFFDDTMPPPDNTDFQLFSTLIAICLLILFLLYALWLVVEMGFLRGTKGASKYGPDPLAPLTDPEAENN